MKNTLTWAHPTSAYIIDCLMFTSFKETEDGVIEKHLTHLNEIHRRIAPSKIIFPVWNIWMREATRPFMIAYPFGLSTKQPYVVRMVIDEAEHNHDVSAHEYVTTIDIRYNVKGVSNHKKFHTLCTDRYDDAKDFVSLAASAQATFHGIFRQHSNELSFASDPRLIESVTDYSSQPSILPYYNAHQPKKAKYHG